MTAEQYRRIYNWFAAHPAVKRIVIFLDRWLPAVPFVCYPVLLFVLGAGGLFLARLGQYAAALEVVRQLAGAVLVPGLTFVGGTALRKRLDRPRPYEQQGFVPLVHKDTKGKSFPSRHALSAAVLAMTWLRFFPTVGGVMVCIALAICVLRVLTGVHFVRDVAAGAAIGFLAGALLWLW